LKRDGKEQGTIWGKGRWHRERQLFSAADNQTKKKREALGRGSRKEQRK